MGCTEVYRFKQVSAVMCFRRAEASGGTLPMRGLSSRLEIMHRESNDMSEAGAHCIAGCTGPRKDAASIRLTGFFGV